MADDDSKLVSDPSRKGGGAQYARLCRTIGDVERMAGIGQSHAERFAFWRQFAHLKEAAFAAGRAELYRRIEDKAKGE